MPGMANAFTVDVEDYYQVEAFAGVVDRSTWSSLPSRVEHNTEILLDLLDECEGTKGTFFVLGCVAQRHPALVRRIAERGHEIASHGMSHRLVYRQTPDVFRQETRDSKALLEDLCQQPVIGYRAATYSITRKSMWALDILSELGFRYDSSIFPIWHDKYGIPDARLEPGRIETPSGARLVEFPISVAEVGRFRLPVAGGGYFRLLPYGVTRWGLERVNRAGRPFVFYLHPWEIDPEQPRVRRAPALSRFRHYLNLHRSAGRLRTLLGDFRFGPMTQVLAARGLL